MSKKTKTLEEIDRDKFLALHLLADSDGGKIITQSLLSDVAAIVERLTVDYKTAPHFDLVRLCSDLNSKLSLYRALTRSENKLKQVEEIIKEALAGTNE